MSASTLATPPPARLQAGDPDLAPALLAALDGPGSAVVCGVDVGDDDALLAVVGCAAQPSAVGNGGGTIYDVTPRPEADRLDVSSTAERFPLHTDSTFLVAPHDVIALGCLEAPQDGGGVSHLLALDVILTALRAQPDGDAIVGALGDPCFPFVLEREEGDRVVAPIAIVRQDGPQPVVRYRDDLLEEAAQAVGFEMRPSHRAALEAFDAVLADRSLHASLLLRPGEVLLVDNRRLLHGRTAITGGARRTMRRVKAFRRPA